MEHGLLDLAEEPDERVEGTGVGVFEPDILNEAVVGRGAWRAGPPERRLMVAVLTDAIECFQKNLSASNSRRRRLFIEAEMWIRSEDITWPFSFRNICDILGVDADALRERTEAWKQHQLQSFNRSPRLASGV
jgi:hypothetical protein